MEKAYLSLSQKWPYVQRFIEVDDEIQTESDYGKKTLYLMKN